jgi:hypothetical protein
MAKKPLSENPPNPSEGLFEYFDWIRKKSEENKKDIIKKKFEKSLKDARNEGDNLASSDGKKYNSGTLKARIKRSLWFKNSNPSVQANTWLIRFVLKNSQIYAYKKRLMQQGQFFTFEYLNPKYKDTPSLPWFDKYPLVLSLGAVPTKLGVRNLGFNLHLVPPKVRLIFICIIHDIYKSHYRSQEKAGVQNPVPLEYKKVIKKLAPYGGMFCVRMYIPSRQRVIIRFPYVDWEKAIFLPSRGYYGIKALKLQKEWQKHIKGLGFGTRTNATF